MNTDRTTVGKIGTPLFFTVIPLEIAYIYLRTKLTHAEFFPLLTIIDQELAISCNRALTLALVLYACWHLNAFPDFFTKPKFNRTTIVLLMVIFFLALIVPKTHHTQLSAQLTFAATTIFVAVREELVYRYVLQNWLEGSLLPKVSLVGSIVLTSVLFTLYHLGVQPFYAMPWIFLASLLLGTIYIVSGKSLSLVIVCHFICDLLFI